MHYQNSEEMVKTALVAFPLASLSSRSIGEEAALEGAMISSIKRSGLDSEDKESNLFWVFREAVVSNNDVEKFGIPHFMHSYTFFTRGFRILSIVDDKP